VVAEQELAHFLDEEDPERSWQREKALTAAAQRLMSVATPAVRPDLRRLSTRAGRASRGCCSQLRQLGGSRRVTWPLRDRLTASTRATRTHSEHRRDTRG